MNVLVIGGAGFVGSNLVRRLLAEPDTHVTVFDSLDPIYRSTRDSVAGLGDRLTFVEGDLLDEDSLDAAVKDQQVVFHCAGQTSHPYSMAHPLVDVKVNCLGSLRVLEAAQRLAPDSTVVFTSSSTIVGRAESETIDEDCVDRPCDIYSANKGVAEKYFQLYHDMYGLKTVSLRLPNLYGAFGKADPQFGFINFFISLAQAGKPITVFGDGEQRRNVLYAEDAAEVLLRASQDQEMFGRALYASGDEHLSICEIAEGIDKCFGGGGVKLVPWPEDRKQIDVGSVRLSSSRLRKITGWAPKYEFMAGLERAKQIIDEMGQENTQ